MLTTDASESFNGVLKGARGSIQALIARIFFILVKFFRTRREEAKQWNTSLTPKNKKKLIYHKDMACGYSRQRFSRAE